ncbi:hypothetical protein GS462_11140 [Rhodococcus hoagii]|nr:hypothetical protein [Prescottella equi]MBM4650967.1 hypothetical protein [Prescottella equi]MBM4686686.1 hypothetical protein [Prescottella equi]
MSKPWPWPADTPLDIARRLAQAYRTQLANSDPEACERLDAEATEFGQTWIVPATVHFDEDDIVLAPEAAELAGVTTEVIYQWAARAHIPRRPGPAGRTGFRVGDVLDHVTKTRQKRAQSRRIRQQSS